MPARWPATWGARFVLKPLGGTNSRGVMIIERASGKDAISGKTFRGREDLATYQRRHPKDAGDKWLAEALVAPEPRAGDCAKINH